MESWRVSGVCYDFIFDSVFFMFQNKYKEKSLNHDENIKTIMLKKHKFTTKYAAIYGQ